MDAGGRVYRRTTWPAAGHPCRTASHAALRSTLAVGRPAFRPGAGTGVGGAGRPWLEALATQETTWDRLGLLYRPACRDRLSIAGQPATRERAGDSVELDVGFAWLADGLVQLTLQLADGPGGGEDCGLAAACALDLEAFDANLTLRDGDGSGAPDAHGGYVVHCALQLM